ncbi:hypothetical protein [Pseudarthrobacter sp. H2]|uniref:hypothetical protein n=1 Tax=Pseudarthrobacter sp. H2 TaxID=3418415 RepID=UPI003CF27641
MSAGTIEIKQGTDNSLKLHFSTKDATTGVVTDVNITGWTIYFTVKKTVRDTDAQALISKTVTSHSGPTQGITYVPISYGESSLPVRGYVYDIKSVDAGGARQSSGVGTLIVSDVVRDN